MLARVPSKLLRMVSVSVDMDVSTSVPFDTAFVFSWNDVLFPSTWMNLSNFLQQSHTPSADTAMVHSVLAQLDLQIVQVLTHAMSLGPVFVVCEDSVDKLQWISRTCLPRTHQLLSTVRLVCPDAAPSPTWHLQVMQAVHRHMLQSASGTIAIATLGNERLRTGCLTLVLAGGSVVTKIVSVKKTHPTPFECYEQLKVFSDGLEDIVFHNAAFDIVLN
ncbi:Aste57867_24853 [Aphanomyces stellatus]|uniref:Aste57867_24853 protein n=1 Tax=Aphanomyces stellatus TaxID=120398 RepID=A0A485LVT6_9STRA|nr:hypothetical protein As57867_024775 [Aphanomyces stellatus]VFU01487.1 Aste57867_24853 [Aphanomyces stellatus]